MDRINIVTATRTITGTEPVALADMKTLLGIEAGNTDYDTLLTSMITGARELIEEEANVSLVASNVVASIDYQRGWVLLPYGPVAAISSVKNYDTTGDENDTLTSGSEYYTTDAMGTRLVFITEIPDYSVKVTYTTTAHRLIETAKNAIYRIVYDWYHNVAELGTMQKDVSRMIAKLRNRDIL